MKNTIKLNRYPVDYEEEKMPQIIVEIRYRKGTHNETKAKILANEIETFLNNK